MTSSESSEAVNGKIDMGTRKLKVAYVENATTLYAYLESEFHVLKEYTDKFSEVYKTSPEIDDKIIESETYLIYSDKDKCAARARIEQQAGIGEGEAARPEEWEELTGGERPLAVLATLVGVHYTADDVY